MMVCSETAKKKVQRTKLTDQTSIYSKKNDHNKWQETNLEKLIFGKRKVQHF